MKFTDRFLQSIKSPEKEYCIREGHGFTLRVLPSGVKTFQYIYTLNGKRHRMNLGQYPATTLADAREKFRAAAIMVGKGISPLEQPVATEPEAALTIQKLVADYKAFVELHMAKSTANETVRTVDKYIIPVWKERNAQEIRRKNAISLIDPIAATAPGQARGVMKIARAMFNYALDRELVEINPFTRLPAAVPSIKPVSTSRTLSDAEIKSVWDTIHSKTPPGSAETRRALLLILITAQRPGEVAGLAWSEIEKKWWTIPQERIKTRIHRQESHRVFLTPIALRIIGKNPGYSDYVFPGPAVIDPVDQKAVFPPLQRKALSHMVCDERAGGRPAGEGKKTEAMAEYFGLPRWTPHDLRRTAATKMSELGCPDENPEPCQEGCHRYLQPQQIRQGKAGMAYQVVSPPGGACKYQIR
ncbi:MAG: integrase arm-type DNA-binding domain-containing protein [Pedobacter sp.]